MASLLRGMFQWQQLEGVSDCGPSGSGGVDEGRVVRVIAATTVSGMLEWYDFAIFGFMAREIGEEGQVRMTASRG